ncbi:MAG: hypothetical protein ABIK31_01585 [candidate division WOR-3 bacterium]
MNDKKKLKKLVQIIGDLLKIKGNEWLVDEILKTIADISPVEEIAKHSVIQRIHEFCIEEKIEKQANEFYQSFPIQEIKDQLIQDYKKMEHERRRDDFENFCLCLYQQIENITNFLFQTKISPNWEVNKNKIAYRFPDGKTLTQKDLIVGNANDWYANGKFKALLFYFYFNEKIKVIIPFNERVSVFDELYQMRNLNHRGSKPSEYQQKTLDNIKGNEAKYYFKFYGFLQDIITQLEISLQNQTVPLKETKNKTE